jgi:hypothetical protein
MEQARNVRATRIPKSTTTAPGAPTPKLLAAPGPAASQDQIARRAYQIWEQTGRPAHRELEHWLQAERELQSRS